MAKLKRKPTTVYLDLRLAQAAKMKAALTGESVSDQINAALAATLRRNEKALRLIRERRNEPRRSFEDVISDMKKDGLL